MLFAPRAPSTQTSIKEWQAGPYILVMLAYAFGQFRMQVWCDVGGSFPEVIGQHF